MFCKSSQVMVTGWFNTRMLINTIRKLGEILVFPISLQLRIIEFLPTSLLFTVSLPTFAGISWERGGYFRWQMYKPGAVLKYIIKPLISKSKWFFSKHVLSIHTAQAWKMLHECYQKQRAPLSLLDSKLCWLALWYNGRRTKPENLASFDFWLKCSHQ